VVGVIAAWLFGLARWVSKHPVTGRLIGFGFQFGSWLIPVKPIVVNKWVIAFPHPKPSYENHVLVIPKRAIATFTDLLLPENQRYLFELFNTAQALAKTWGWAGFSFGVNGGAYQEVRQVHFHLYQGQAHFRIFDQGVGPRMVFEHPKPCREAHLVILLPADWQDGLGIFSNNLIQLIEKQLLAYAGYTVFVQFDPLPESCGLILHLVSGESLQPSVGTH
jgi:diadenosine tetraphosphate (Ap4A) HIT family hydrolase